ncbi:MAG: hypothetical protein ACRD2E_13840 [Terriglobales bacterium]
MPKTLHLRCPDCGAQLQVDAQTGAILSHTRPVRRPADVDLSQAGNQLRRQEDQRNQRYADAVEQHRQRDRILGQKFDDALRRARENPDEQPAPRDIDLD